AWSLGMQFGVKTEFAKTALASGLPLEKVAVRPKLQLPAVNTGGAWRFPYNGATSALVVNRLLKAGAKGSMTKPDGNGVARGIATARPDTCTKATESLEVQSVAAPPSALSVTINKPRVGIYQSFDPSMDEGWTRFVLDDYGWDYTPLHN